MEALEITFGIIFGLIFALLGYLLIVFVGFFCWELGKYYWQRKREQMRLDRRSPEQKVRDLRRELGYDD